MCSYQDRVIAFLDVLGFGRLVEMSASDSRLQSQILEALTSIQPEAIHEDAYCAINYDLVPESELKQVEEITRIANKNFREMHPVCITYFSDSLVISADSNDPLASQMVLDMVAKLSIRLWEYHSLLLRGSVTNGLLFHAENGPLFGPAMNRAYHLESECAVHPRVVIDKICLDNFRRFDTFSIMESLIEDDEDYSYLSLATALRHVINDSPLVLAGESVIAPYKEILCKAPDQVKALGSTFKNASVRRKYVWLESELRARAYEMESP